LGCLISTADAETSLGRCSGYGDLQSLYVTDWDAGLPPWTEQTFGVVNQGTFNTPDWAVADNLPDGRTGKAAFVSNQDTGNCGSDDDTGGLRLESPTITIPSGIQVPRISVDHWYQTDYWYQEKMGWDGGNFKISVDGGGSFAPIPASRIETATYDDVLEPALDPDGFPYNTNPLAGQAAFTGTNSGLPTGRWVQSRINLLGLAHPGNKIKLRIEFGMDGCNRIGQIPKPLGWYIAEVEFYSCSGELPPSNCGNGVINGGEKCDDGNDFVGDGCSSSCQIEEGWQCTLPAPAPPDAIADPGFELGWDNPFWDEISNNGLGSPICDVATCRTAGPSEGNYWVWLGGVSGRPQEGSVAQTVLIPENATALEFDLEISRCDSARDYLEVLIDGEPLVTYDGSNPLCGILGYTRQSVDISRYADGGSHTIAFHSETFSDNQSRSNFFVDRVEMVGTPSICRRPGTNLTLVKHVINDGFGDAVPEDWILYADGPSSFDGPGPRVLSADDILPGLYNLTESATPAGYQASDWVCVGGNQTDGNTIGLSLGDAAVCTVTNNDVSPQLTVVNTIVNDNGGPITDPDAFHLKVDGFPVLHSATNIVDVGDHKVTAEILPDYDPGVWSGDCNPDGTVTLNLGQNATCTIVNDDMAPSLTLVKQVVTDDGGNAEPSDWTLIATHDQTGARYDPEQPRTGTYTLSEEGPEGYLLTSLTCSDQPGVEVTKVTLTPGESVTCTFVNDDIAPSLTVVKRVVNDNGRTATVSDFNIGTSAGTLIFGPGTPDGDTIIYVATTLTGLQPGVPYSLWEGDLPYYNEGRWMCRNVDSGAYDSGSVTLELGENVTCEISNDDVALPSLTVIKKVTNDNGGMATVADFSITTSAGVLVFGPGSKVGNTTTYMASKLTDLEPGVAYSLSENDLQNYIEGRWKCRDADSGAYDSGSVTLGLGEHVTCEISNDDLAPASLTVVKRIVKDNGGSATVADFNVTTSAGNLVFGAGSTSGKTTTYIASTLRNLLPGVPYQLSESDLTQYQEGDWTCTNGDGGPFNSGSVTLAPGATVTCEITNNDIAPSLTLVKDIVNDDGGDAVVADWTLMALSKKTGAAYDPQQPQIGTYVLSESGPDGYELTSLTCSNAPDVEVTEVTLELGANVTCTFVNDDIAPSLTIVKHVVNNNGGTATVADFDVMTDAGTLVFDSGVSVGSTTTYTANAIAGLIPGQPYSLSEIDAPGYLERNWKCRNADSGAYDSGSVTLELGEDVTCEITNDDITPTLKLVKTIMNDDGGNVEDPYAFVLRVNGFRVFHGQTNALPAGSHQVSEDPYPGYQAGSWGGDCNPDGTIELALDQDAVCTITNDDIAPTLTVIKTVINDEGGTASVSDFGIVTDAGPLVFDTGTGSNPTVYKALPLTVSSNVAYTLAENDLSGYSEGLWSCTNGDGGAFNDGVVTLEPGETVTCEIANDDEGVTPTTALYLYKRVINDNGGQAVATDWTLTAAGYDPQNPQSGTYALSETGPGGYEQTSLTCSDNPGVQVTEVTLEFGKTVTCTFVNDDIAPTLTVNQVCDPVDDDGLFNLLIDGSGSTDTPCGGSYGPVEIAAGIHTVSETAGTNTALSNYISVIGGDCAANGIVSLAPGDNKTCTITNTRRPVLSLIKSVIKNNGGEAVAGDWALTAIGYDPQSPLPGTYTLSESGPAGYTLVSLTCDNATGQVTEVTLGPGEHVTCTFVNDDIAPTLTIEKACDPMDDDGLFNLLIDGSGSTDTACGGSYGPIELAAGAHTVSETAGSGTELSSYDSIIGGDCAANGGITLAVGEDKVCTVTNRRKPTLTVTKVCEPVSDDGLFNLLIDGTGSTDTACGGSHGPVEIAAGDHTVSETAGAGAALSDYISVIGGDCAVNGIVSLAPGDNKTCTITNTRRPTLSLVKEVINDNGGEAVAGDWVLTAAGYDPQNPQAGTYALSESGGPDGYEQTSLTCDNATGQVTEVTLNPGENVTCTFINDDLNLEPLIFSDGFESD